MSYANHVRSSVEFTFWAVAEHLIYPAIEKKSATSKFPGEIKFHMPTKDCTTGGQWRRNGWLPSTDLQTTQRDEIVIIVIMSGDITMTSHLHRLFEQERPA